MPDEREFLTYIFDSFEDGFKAAAKIWSNCEPDFFSLGELSFLKYSQNSEIFFIKSSDSEILSRYIKARYIDDSLTGRILEKVFLNIPWTKKSFKYIDNTLKKKGCLSMLTVGFEGERKIIRNKKMNVISIAKKFAGVEYLEKSFYRDRFKNFSKLGEIIKDHFPGYLQNFKLATFDLSLPTAEVTKINKTLNELLKKHNKILLLYSELYSSISTMGLDIIFKEEDKDQYFNFLNELSNETLKIGGSISFAHGIGTRFLPYLKQDVGGNYLAFMEKIKKALDPKDILNPGKIGNL
jgi:hypothetical protein